MKTKKLRSVLFLILFYNLFLNAQTVSIIFDENLNKYTYQEILEVKDATAEQLYDRALIWLALGHKTSSHEIKYADKQSKKIICRGTFYYGYVTQQYSLILEFKENRYRITAMNFNSRNGAIPESGFVPIENYPKKRTKWKTMLEENFQEIIGHLNEHVQKTVPWDNNW